MDVGCKRESASTDLVLADELLYSCEEFLSRSEILISGFPEIANVADLLLYKVCANAELKQPGI